MKRKKNKVSAKERARRQAQSRQSWRTSHPDKAVFQDAYNAALFHARLCPGCPRCKPRFPYGGYLYGGYLSRYTDMEDW